MKKHFVRLSAFLLTLLVAIGLLSRPTIVRAQGAPPNSIQSWFSHTAASFIQDLEAARAGGIVKEAADSSSIINPQLVLACEILGCTNDLTHPFGYQRSLLAFVDRTVIAMYATPVASTQLFLVDLGKSIGLLHPAYAQGVGFSGLEPLLPIWKAFRNIAYILLAIILIAVGFMVMLRKKIDPKTVVTVQNSLPRIVVALILITFSYAIVGLMIDLMYLSMLFLITILVNASGGLLGSDTAAKYLGGGFWSAVGALFSGGIRAFDDFIALIPKGVSATITIVPGLLAGLFSGGKLSGFITGLAAAPALFLLLIALVVLFGIVRLLFMLIDAYIHIIIALLTAPIQLLFDAIPGVNAFGAWFRNLLSRLIVFPVTAAMLLIGTILTRYEKNPVGIPGFGSQSPALWGPPFLTSDSGVHGMAGFIGLGILLSIPMIVAGIQKTLKGESIIPGGPGAIFGPAGAAFGQLLQVGYYGTFITSAFRHKQAEKSAYQQVREGASKGIGMLTGGGGAGGGGH